MPAAGATPLLDEYVEFSPAPMRRYYTAPTQWYIPAEALSKRPWRFAAAAIAVSAALVVVLTVVPALSTLGAHVSEHVRGEGLAGAQGGDAVSEVEEIRLEAAAYDVAKVDWGSLQSDLRAFVQACECAPILVRLSWHDSGTFNASDGTGGSHAEQRFPTGEAQDPANAGLGVARAFLRSFKERYPVVGFADLWALAATVAIAASGGPLVPFRAGRVDGAKVAAVPHGRLPNGALGASHLRTVFYRMGFDDEDIVVLSGAHTLGRCHADRSGFEGPWTHEPLRFDNEYFKDLLSCEWKPSLAPTTSQPQFACESMPGLMMLSTDVSLVTDTDFRKYVERFAADQAAFFAAFVKAFKRLQENGHQELREVGI